MDKTLFLIDGNSLLNRAYYALPPLTTVRGEPTNAVYGFVTMLNRLLEEYKPTSIFVAFDMSGPTFRHQEYDQYKANRKGMPDDLRPQVGLLKEVLDAWGIPRLELSGYEADDLIGTAAKQGEAQGMKVRIVTGDRDALQLISPQISVLLTKRGITELEYVDMQALQDKYELEPWQIIDLKGLMGDPSDNIPGVPGVGEKTALRLLKQYRSMDNLYEHIDQEKGKLKERLITYQEQAKLSKRLATIDCQVPIEPDLTVEPKPNRAAMTEIFQRLEFVSLLNKLGIAEQSIPESVSTQTNSDLIIQQLMNKSDVNFDQFTQQLAEGQGVVIDLETDHVWVWAKDTVWYINKQTAPDVWAYFWQVLPQITVDVCNDAKGLYRLLANYEQSLQIGLDVGLAAYVLDPGGKLDLSSLAVKYGFDPMPAGLDAFQSGAWRVQCMRNIAPHLRKQLETDELWSLYTTMELPLARVLAKMEHHGIQVNLTKLAELSREMEEKLSQLTNEIHELAGEQFNINSPKQLGAILFDKLGLPVLKKTKTGPSTSAEVLEQLSFHPLVANLLEFRQLSKLKSTYADALVNLQNPHTQRIHTTFNQMVTATGRLSSTNPNLQNIPIRTEEGRRIREAFEPRDGWVLLSADYSQIELRVLAHISGDERLIDAFNQGKDIHTQTAAEILGVPLDKVTEADRSAAKAVNFGIVYGISSFGLSRGTHLSPAKAQEYIDQYFARYPKVKEYMDNIVAFAQEHGYVTTLLKRRRYLPDINSKNYTRRSFAQRMAMNTPIQGSAADIIKLAMLQVDQQLIKHGLQGQLLLQVHDELVLEVPPEEVAETAALVKNCMETVLDLAVNLDVEVKVGPNWKDVAKYNV